MYLSCFEEMFKIKRKLIIALILSLTVLAGCGQKGNKAVPIFSADGTSDTSKTASPADESSSSTGPSNTSTPVSPDPSDSSEQSPSQESSYEPAIDHDTSVPPSESVPGGMIEAPDDNTQTVIYNYDPENSCSITFDGESITVRGVYGDLFSGVAEGYPPMNIQSSVENGMLTCVLTPKITDFDKRYGTFSIQDKELHLKPVFIDLANGSITFPDTSELVKSQNTAINAVIDASDAKVAQYITLDGSRDGISQILDEVKRISDEICEGIESDYEKLRAISYWVSNNIYYDHPVYNIGAPQYCLTLEYMLKNFASICGGYSNMTSALCAAQGIRCLNITGMAVNNGKCYLQDTVGAYHEWNVAEIDGRQIIVDSGWNSGKSINANGTIKNGSMYYNYFDISADVFVLDHKTQAAEYRDYWALA